MKKRLGLTALSIIAVFISFQYFYPGNPQSIDTKNRFEIIAHRGAHVMWQKGAYDPITGCEATHIYPPTAQQTYIENTLESIQTAFDYGATMVEIDIRHSKDNVLVVNHEEDLACKTNGTGKIYDYTVEELKQLDVGYGFTHDGGKTYPYRGKGVGKMPTLLEVLKLFPNKKFLIDHKDRKKETGQILVSELKTLSVEQRTLIYYWGSPEISDYIQAELPEVKRFFATREEIKDCLTPYVVSIGILGFGTECQNRNIGMNRNYSRYMWGWPYSFLKKAQDNNSPVYLMVDSEKDIGWAKGLPIAGIVTDYIELVGPRYQK